MVAVELLLMRAITPHKNGVWRSTRSGSVPRAKGAGLVVNQTVRRSASRSLAASMRQPPGVMVVLGDVVVSVLEHMRCVRECRIDVAELMGTKRCEISPVEIAVRARACSDFTVLLAAPNGTTS